MQKNRENGKWFQINNKMTNFDKNYLASNTN